MDKIPITVVVPVRNEERNIGDCLALLGNFSEIVVVDSGSTDRTIAISEGYGCVVLNFRWNGRFPKKRNWTLLNYNFSTDWVLFLDADEQLTDKFIAELGYLIFTTKHSGFWLLYNNYFMGKPLRFGVPQRKLALFRRKSGLYENTKEFKWSNFDMEIHEHPQIRGTVGSLKSRIIHNDYKGLSTFIARHNEYSDWEARRFLAISSDVLKRPKMTSRQKVKYALIETRYFSVIYFLFTYIIRLGFLDGKTGFDYAVMRSAYFYQIALKIKEYRISQGTDAGG
jgi:glycosyltransferase involved in cell wall biosynthesis